MTLPLSHSFKIDKIVGSFYTEEALEGFRSSLNQFNRESSQKSELSQFQFSI